jgi:molybdopterin biosynthesis enzyme MoaB
MNNEPKTIAKRVYHLFRELNSDADIVITYNKHDMKKGQEDKQGKKLEKLRTERERAIYPLYRIVQDSEASILKRIEDFLSV